MASNSRFPARKELVGLHRAKQSTKCVYTDKRNKQVGHGQRRWQRCLFARLYGRPQTSPLTLVIAARLLHFTDRITTTQEKGSKRIDTLSFSLVRSLFAPRLWLLEAHRPRARCRPHSAAPVRLYSRANPVLKQVRRARPWGCACATPIKMSTCALVLDVRTLSEVRVTPSSNPNRCSSFGGCEWLELTRARGYSGTTGTSAVPSA